MLLAVHIKQDRILDDAAFIEIHFFTIIKIKQKGSVALKDFPD